MQGCWRSKLAKMQKQSGPEITCNHGQSYSLQLNSSLEVQCHPQGWQLCCTARTMLPWWRRWLRHKSTSAPEKARTGAHKFTQLDLKAQFLPDLMSSRYYPEKCSNEKLLANFQMQLEPCLGCWWWGCKWVEAPHGSFSWLAPKWRPNWLGGATQYI